MPLPFALFTEHFKDMEMISRWEFDIYALALPRGHGFGRRPPVGAWRSADGFSFSVLIRDVKDNSFGYRVLRRRTDHVWTETATAEGLTSREEAIAEMELQQRNGEPPEPIPPGIAARPSLFDLQTRTPSDIFRLLNHESHIRGAWVFNQLYLALPRPDRNWASDCQTANFHTRLWEAQLLASFREQGLLVTQPHESPDFRLENRSGGVGWVEAVTANPTVPFNHFNVQPTQPPSVPKEVFFGEAALRFAKTLGNKLARRYDQLPHTSGQPFMIAIADFQAPASMVWSREALIGYLFGEGAEEVEINGQKQARAFPITYLQGDTKFPAGLFADSKRSELAAVIFSNACAVSKLNRVAVSGTETAPQGLRYTRVGQFFDRTPGALRAIPFCLDVTSTDYRQLWPIGYEPWSAEIEVFHNPFAQHPVNFELLPEVTHWFREDGELVCRSFYKTSILWSKTHIQNANHPPLRLEDFLAPSVEPET